MPAPAPVVRLAAGDAAGRRADGVLAFGGLPYAAPPVGPLRWAPPAPRAPWTGVREARDRVASAPQPTRPIVPLFFGELPPADEDCLGVDVWTPALDGARPVLVWLHGGGFTVGAAGAPVFDGAVLCRALDAVVVCANYRLGSLGWLHHPALAARDGAPCDDWGLQDQVAALRWVAEHAAALGGDPARVTLAGESAGGASVVALLGARGAEGLFARALAMSPPLGEAVFPADRAAAWAEGLAAALLGGACPGGPTRPDATAGTRAHGPLGLDHLRAVGAAEVVAAHEAALRDGPFAQTRGGALPVVHPATLPADPLEVPAAAVHVPVLVGTNADEGSFFFRLPGRVARPEGDALLARVAHLPGVVDAAATLAAARERWGTEDPNELLVRLGTEAIFAEPVQRWSAARAAAGGTIHRYRLEHPSPQPGLGALHSVGVPLLFGSHATTEPGRWVAGAGAASDAASAELQHAVAGFVHDGSPGWAPQAPGRTPEIAVLGG